MSNPIFHFYLLVYLRYSKYIYRLAKFSSIPIYIYRYTPDVDKASQYAYRWAAERLTTRCRRAADQTIALHAQAYAAEPIYTHATRTTAK